MFDVAVSIAQFLSVLGLAYGFMLTIKHRESAGPSLVPARARRAERRARHSLRLHRPAARAANGR